MTYDLSKHNGSLIFEDQLPVTLNPYKSYGNWTGPFLGRAKRVRRGISTGK